MLSAKFETYKDMEWRHLHEWELGMQTFQNSCALWTLHMHNGLYCDAENYSVLLFIHESHWINRHCRKNVVEFHFVVAFFSLKLIRTALLTELEQIIHKVGWALKQAICELLGFMGILKIHRDLPFDTLIFLRTTQLN